MNMDIKSDFDFGNIFFVVQFTSKRILDQIEN